MASTKKGGGVITTFWAISQMSVNGVLEGKFFLALLITANPKRKSFS